eukprot:TRINITY_DN2278_c0_g4_i1.p1 TRINITY_DN2278_c0_g4~~TRINITY_DN2278_c0_g4_i1.p1  ORF type:complete len:590 (+),score=213.39 TRINITY_DN2278_c0_g4_i1:67-1770(+)
MEADDPEQEQQQLQQRGGRKERKGRSRDKRKRAADEDDLEAPGPKRAVRKSAGAVKATITIQSHLVRSAKSRGGSKMVKKGAGVVDPYSGLQDRAHVLQEPGCVWQCTLNQTNLDTNNNKFYIIQLIESDAGDKWWTWNRWGRVGAVGSSKVQEFRSLAAAKADFCKKFRDKTLNEWSDRENFVKHHRKYQLLHIDYGEDVDEGAAQPKQKPRACKLDPRLRLVMAMITDQEGMGDELRHLSIDTKRLPLGKVSKRTVVHAFAELKKVEEELNSARPDEGRLLAASSQYYTLIPHDVGMQQLSVIRSMEQLAKCAGELRQLADLEVSVTAMSKLRPSGRQHPLDAAFASLRVSVQPLPRLSGEWKLVANTVATTHGKTHNSYRLEVKDVFAVSRGGPAESSTSFAADPNRMMLWHGSRLSNWMGILSQGLRVAPPEAPSTGYMFGKGLYFADVVSKSANYCHCSRGKDEGLLLLSEVALGNSLDLSEARFIERLPPGLNSVKGFGRYVPRDLSHRPEGPEGPVWPTGPMADADLAGPTTLLYNEYVVYDVAQVRMRYLVRLKFHYSD